MVSKFRRNSGSVPPTTNVAPLPSTWADESWPEPKSKKKSSLPSPRQRGQVPPSLEICHFAPVQGKGATYISGRPVSLELYATHRASGEKAADSSSEEELA